MALIGIPSCVRIVENRRFHGVGHRFIDSVVDYMACCPILIPAIGLDKKEVSAKILDGYIAQIDGLFVTGSQSGVDPQIYGEELAIPKGQMIYDKHRDATSLPLIRRAKERGIPVFAICRGMQELNVVYGGSLMQELGDKAIVHRDQGVSTPPEQRFAHAHRVDVVKDSMLADIIGDAGSFMVNSIHNQAIKKLGDGVTPLAYSPDGLVEAITIADAKGFILGVQWHPEWNIPNDHISQKLFDGFLTAVHEYKKSKA